MPVRLILVLLFVNMSLFAQAQNIRAMDFRNQNITDILMALAESGRQSIIVDETVMGTATFHFSDSTFEEALFRFTDACNLFVDTKHNAYYVSRIRFSKEDDKINLNAENVDVEMLVRAISRNAGVTIIYDQLPRTTISINSEGIRLLELLEIIIRRHGEYSIIYENSAFYIRRAQETNQSNQGRLSSNSITTRNGLFNINVQRASFSQIISQLFRTAGKEYSLLNRNDSTIDNLYFQDKEFEQLLRLILEQANCDFVEADSIYYIFEVQRRDILKKLRDVIVFQLRHISAENAVALIPNEYSASSFIKTDRVTNSIYLTGSTEEITPIAEFLSIIDIPSQGVSFNRYEINYIPVREFLTLLPASFARITPVVVPGTNAFIAHIGEEQAGELSNFISLVDRQNMGRAVHLRYIKSEELLQSLPPSATREEIVTTQNPTLIFYRGTQEKYNQFLEHLTLIDQPKPQIRYQLLVMQYQRSDDINWTRNLSVTPSESGAGNSMAVAGTFSNLVNINFDVISEFGLQFALQLNLQIGEDRAKVLADTTLNGITGQDIRFENTTTFRYRDTTIDPETGRPFYTGTTREINSGLIVNLNGWVSGDGMITMNVNANVSKQDESGANASATTNPPPTSSRVVNTQVRTRSGTPIVIGGLLQVERLESIRRLPLLGKIPLLGRLFQDVIYQDITTEMVIYIIPHIHNGPELPVDYSRRIENYYNRFVRGE